MAGLKLAACSWLLPLASLADGLRTAAARLAGAGEEPQPARSRTTHRPVILARWRSSACVLQLRRNAASTRTATRSGSSSAGLTPRCDCRGEVKLFQRRLCKEAAALEAGGGGAGGGWRLCLV